MRRRGHSLRRRLAAAFALFALASALCFGALGVLFVYTIEDSFFANMLDQEAARQRSAWASTGQLATPLRGFVTVHRSAATFPPDLARALAAGARGTEVAGEPVGELADGQRRHYHLRRLELGGAAAGAAAGTSVAPSWLVAEVSRELVVRPRLPFILGVLGAVLLAMLALTAGAGYWLARRASAPLIALAQLVHDAAPAQLPRGFAARFPDNEIGALADALENAMARIAGFIEREQHFTRDASHELRTPLAVIEGAAQLLAHEPMAPRARDQLQRIRSAGAHMAQTVETLLSLAREAADGDGSEHAAARETFALLPLVEAAVVRFAHLLDGKAVEVRVEVAAHEAVTAHRQALAILLSNLVSNAFAHTRHGHIRIYREGGALVVADSGPGIAPALRDTLYQAGVKGEGSSGFGLGLSIAKRLGERFGIGLEIDSSGEGTRAVLHL